MFFSSLITPVILIVLYGTFLSNVYKDSFKSSLPEFLSVSDKLINGTVAAQLAAALLAVSCVTVTLCVNLTMIQDKANEQEKILMYHRQENRLSIYRTCTVWQCAFENRVLSVKNTGTDVGGRNDRQCRIWIHLWSLYANL